jgi:aspartyl-tRNA(Asn)/glutamyl-tRNA(Gln) amidotransferase subunit A
MPRLALAESENPMDDNLAFAPAYELKRLIAEKQVSPVELTEMYFRRIDRLNSQLNSYLTLVHDEALAAAKSAEDAVVRGDRLGPLHGLPISIKDLEPTKGIRTTKGSLAFKDWVPDKDSIVVERVRRSGAVILGKTNTPEFGYRGTSENLLGDPCYNPWNPERTAGGSSGGAGASVVAGLCALAQGSDGGGSIRIPASFCGVYGIKPTLGRVPLFAGDGTPDTHNHLSQPGPMTRTVRDSAMLLQALSGYDSRDSGSIRQEPPDFVAALDRDISGLRIAWSPDYGYAAVDQEVVEVTSRAATAFEQMGCSVDDSSISLDAPFEAFWTIFSAVGYTRYGNLLDQEEPLTDYARECLQYGATVTAAQYAGALAYIDGLKQQYADLFEEYDLLLSPVTAVTAFPPYDRPDLIAGREVDPFWGFLPFTYPINMIGNPAASIPAGLSSDGMPIGLHIVGRSGDEATVLAASAAFEQARPWVDQRPQVS